MAMKRGLKWVLGGLLGLLAFSGSASAKPTNGGKKPGGNGGKKPGGNGGTKPGGNGGTTPGGNGDNGFPDLGTYFGILVLPDWWDDAGNGFYVDPDCEGVAEGARFLPMGFAKNAEEFPTLAETLQPADGQAWGYISYLVNVEGIGSPEGVALRVLAEGNALCADLPMNQWSDGIREWFDSFVDRIGPYVFDELGGIDFGGDEDVS